MFNIAGAGPQTINVLSALPTITGTVILDATTQPGFVGTPLIELNGAGAGAGVNGLTVASTDSTIRGFVINRFSLSGIALTGDRNTVVGNFIGTNVAGTSALGNGIDGVEIFSNNNTIGGTTAAQRNIISGNLDDGINIDGTSGNVIQGNYIGTDVTGTLALGNQSDGVLFENSASNNTLGGTAASARNVIAFNADSGVDVITGTGNAFLGNSIHSNTSPGIDLNDDGVTINDLGDPDGGANALQNFPVLASAVTDAATQITIAGTLNGTASTSLRIEFFSNTAADPTGYGEGQTYLGFVNVTTDGAGNASFSTTLTGNVAVGASISATATRANGTFTSFFETSEFAQNIASLLNSPPVNTVPGAQSIPEDTMQAIAGISVSDPNNNVTTVALSVTNGILNVTLSGGASISAGANGSAAMTISGTQAALNATIASLTYRGTLNYSGADILTVTSTDAASASDTDTVAITVSPVNDAPTATNLSAAESYTEDTALNLINIVASDVDSANVTATLTLSDVAAGSLNTATSGAVTSTFVGGVWTASGAIADVNALLAGVTFTPALDYNSNFTIATSVSDGVAPAITGVKAMTGTAVNDAPTATNLSAAESYTEDTALNLINIVASDVDSANVTATLTLSDVAAGSLNTATSGAVTSTFVGGVWTASGALADVNALLAGVTFTPALDYNSNFTIATSVSDGVAPAITGVKAMTGTA